MYKPGEEVSLKGWLRVIDHGKGGDIGALAGVVTTVTYKVTDSQGNRDREGHGAGQRGRWLRHQVHAAEDAEPRLREHHVRDRRAG